MKNDNTIIPLCPPQLSAQNLLKMGLQACEQSMRKHEGSPSGLYIFEPAGTYWLEFDAWEMDGLYIDNAVQLCRARGPQAIIFVNASVKMNVLEALQSKTKDLYRRLAHIVLVCENNRGERAEKAVPVIRDARGKFMKLGTYSAENPDTYKQVFPRFLPDQPVSEADRLVARATLHARGIILDHDTLDAGNRRAVGISSDCLVGP